MSGVVHTVKKAVKRVTKALFGSPEAPPQFQPLPQPKAQLTGALEQPQASVAEDVSAAKRVAMDEAKKRRRARKGREQTVVAGKLGNNTISTAAGRLLGQ